jgi:CheY-like chemotaxis protein
MPGMDGYEVARRLRALGKDRRFRIVAVTGWGQDSERQKAKEAGFDLHLVKPVDLALLARVVEERNGATLH